MAPLQKTSAAEFLPKRHTLESLRAAARSCKGCDLYKNATQTVFGEGPKDASVMLVGEQPGDTEDRQGHPFVGPAGRLLDKPSLKRVLRATTFTSPTLSSILNGSSAASGACTKSR
jgi:uracil-DNA glycosylase